MLYIFFYLPHVALFTCLSVCVIDYKTVNIEDFLIDRKFTYFEINEIEIVDVASRYITFHSLF